MLHIFCVRLCSQLKSTCLTVPRPLGFVGLPVVAASKEAAGDAGPSEGRGAGVVAHVVPLTGADAAALHVAPADAETQAHQTADARPVPETRIVESSLRHRGGVWEEKWTQGKTVWLWNNLI